MITKNNKEIFKKQISNIKPVEFNNKQPNNFQKKTKLARIDEELFNEKNEKIQQADETILDISQKNKANALQESHLIKNLSNFSIKKEFNEKTINQFHEKSIKITNNASKKTYLNQILRQNFSKNRFQ